MLNINLKIEAKKGHVINNELLFFLDMSRSKELKLLYEVFEKSFMLEYQVSKLSKRERRSIILENNIRKCNECLKKMKEGFVIDSGIKYYCSENCLHKNISNDEYIEMYDNGNSDTYWTQFN